MTMHVGHGRKAIRLTSARVTARALPLALAAAIVSTVAAQAQMAQQQCLEQFVGYRTQAEKRGQEFRAARESGATRQRSCQLISIYSNAESEWVAFAAANSAKCGLPRGMVEQLKSAHAHTEDAKNKLCGPR